MTNYQISHNSNAWWINHQQINQKCKIHLKQFMSKSALDNTINSWSTPFTSASYRLSHHFSRCFQRDFFIWPTVSNQASCYFQLACQIRFHLLRDTQITMRAHALWRGFNCFHLLQLTNFRNCVFLFKSPFLKFTTHFPTIHFPFRFFLQSFWFIYIHRHIHFFHFLFVQVLT